MLLLALTYIVLDNTTSTEPTQKTYNEFIEDNRPDYDYDYIYAGRTACITAITAKDGAYKAMDFDDAISVNIKHENRSFLAPIVVAIRYAENGRAGREYGILHPRVKPTYRSQAGWCAATVQKNYDRWMPSTPDQDTLEAFIEFLGSKYCPIGADNDPTGLNNHWTSNVLHHYRKVTQS